MDREQNANENAQKMLTTPDTDWFLQLLVETVKNCKLKIGITLNIGGLLLSGNLVSGKDYFEGLAKDLSSCFPNKEASARIKHALEEYAEKIYSESNQGSSQIPPPAYIHLENANFFSFNGQSLSSNGSVWWRGRMSEIQGFILGTLKTG